MSAQQLALFVLSGKMLLEPFASPGGRAIMVIICTTFQQTLFEQTANECRFQSVSITKAVAGTDEVVHGLQSFGPGQQREVGRIDHDTPIAPDNFRVDFLLWLRELLCCRLRFECQPDLDQAGARWPSAAIEDFQGEAAIPGLIHQHLDDLWRCLAEAVAAPDDKHSC